MLSDEGNNDDSEDENFDEGGLQAYKNNDGTQFEVKNEAKMEFGRDNSQ